MNKLLSFPWLLAAVVVCTVGCVRESSEEGNRVFRFETWVTASVIGVAVGAAGLGFSLRGKSARWGYGLLAVGVLGGLILGPGMAGDRAVVGDDAFSLRVGFWFAPTLHDVRFDEVKMIELTKEEKMGRRGRRTNYYMVFHKHNGESQRVALGELMEGGAAAAVLEVARRRGIPVADAR